MQTDGIGPTQDAKHALVVCDVQPDLLNSIPSTDKGPLLDSIRICLEAARRAKWTIVFTGLRFPSRYDGVDPRHRLYGGLRRLNEKVGDGAAHWFMEGHAGSEIDGSLLRPDDGDVVVWRSRHLPPAEIVSVLRDRGVTNVAVAGIRASHCVQAVCQTLCDEGTMSVAVVRECVADDDPDRLGAVLTHVLPIYADVVPLSEMVDEAAACSGGIERTSTSVLPEANENDEHGGVVRYVADCRRGGHLKLFASHLLRRPEWREYPVQHWYSDVFSGREYVCPLGKRVVDFTDEPQFSRTSMYIKGREWLDEKEKLMTLANSDDGGEGLMPKTYVIENGRWVGVGPQSRLLSSNGGGDDAAAAATGGPWFLKEVDKNGGRSVEVYLTPEECLRNADVNSRYVAQRHVQDPLLTDDGKKCHVKFYNLLLCADDGVSWELHTCRDAFLSTSPNRWSADDVSAGTQVTIARHRRMRPNVAAPVGWKAWGPDMHAKCRDAVTTLVRRAVERGKLSGRPGKTQFEIFSADFVFDTSGKAWIIEFNFTPVLYDPTADQELTTPGLIEYDRLYKLHGRDGAEVHDTNMIREAMSIVFYPDELEEEVAGSEDSRLWNSAGKFRGGGGGTAAKSSKGPTGGATATTTTISSWGSASTDESKQGRPTLAGDNADATSTAVMTGGR